MIDKLEKRINKLEKENKRLFYMANDAGNELFRVKSELEMLQGNSDYYHSMVDELYDSFWQSKKELHNTCD